MIADLNQLTFPRDGLMAEVRTWLESLAAQKYQPTTVGFLINCMRSFDQFLRKRKRKGQVRNVSVADLEAYRRSLIERRLSPATQGNYLQTVKSFFAWQERRGIIFASPARQFKIVRRKRALKYVPSEREVVRLIESIPLARAAGQRDCALIEVAYAAGLRLTELGQLNVDSLDLENRLVRVLGKGQKERVVPLTRAAVEAVHAYLAVGRKKLLRGRTDERALWIAWQWPTRLKRASVAHAVTRRAADAGLDISSHDLRRAFATHMLIRGISPAHLKELLGHATYSHLDEYLRYVPTDLIKIHRRCRPGR